jgi:hypothetical protein
MPLNYFFFFFAYSLSTLMHLSHFSMSLKTQPWHESALAFTNICEQPLPLPHYHRISDISSAAFVFQNKSSSTADCMLTHSHDTQLHTELNPDLLQVRLLPYANLDNRRNTRPISTKRVGNFPGHLLCSNICFSKLPITVIRMYLKLKLINKPLYLVNTKTLITTAL